MHAGGVEKKLLLMRKAYDALPPGGALVALELLIDDARRANRWVRTLKRARERLRTAPGGGGRGGSKMVCTCPHPTAQLRGYRASQAGCAAPGACMCGRQPVAPPARRGAADTSPHRPTHLP